MTSKIKTWLLMGVLTMLLIFIGNLIGGRSGMMLAFGFAFLMNFFGYWFSDKIALRMTKSRPLTEEEAPEVYEIMRRLTTGAQLPMPKLYITPSPQPNAFATGRNPQRGVIAITEGMIRLVNKDELEGVLAHELAHIGNKDILVGSLAAVLAGSIMMIADFARFSLFFGGGSDDEDGSPFGMIGMIAMMILAPLAAMLVQMAISRSREYLADAEGARISGKPEALATALLKLEKGAEAIPMEVNAAASHMFIVNPLSGGSFVRLFSTHPPIEDRVKRLRAFSPPRYYELPDTSAYESWS